MKIDILSTLSNHFMIIIDQVILSFHKSTELYVEYIMILRVILNDNNEQLHNTCKFEIMISIM